MIDTNTIKAVSGSAHIIIDMLTAVVIGMLTIIGYISGFFHGKKSVK